MRASLFWHAVPNGALASDLMAACLLSIAMSQARQSEQASGSRIDLGILQGQQFTTSKGLKASNQKKPCPPSSSQHALGSKHVATGISIEILYMLQVIE